MISERMSNQFIISKKTDRDDVLKIFNSCYLMMNVNNILKFLFHEWISVFNWKITEEKNLKKKRTEEHISFFVLNPKILFPLIWHQNIVNSRFRLTFSLLFAYLFSYIKWSQKIISGSDDRVSLNKDKRQMYSENEDDNEGYVIDDLFMTMNSLWLT